MYWYAPSYRSQNWLECWQFPQMAIWFASNGWETYHTRDGIISYGDYDSDYGMERASHLYFL